MILKFGMQHRGLKFYKVYINGDPGLRKSYDLKLGMQHRGLKFYKAYINCDPGLTLTYITARSNLVT